MSNFIPTSNFSGATTLAANEFAIIGLGIIVGGNVTPAIYGNASNNHLNNMGTIVGNHGVYLTATSFLYNQESGTISARGVGVATLGVGNTINNMGTIFGGHIAVELDQGGKLYNSGTLTAGYERPGSYNTAIFLASSNTATVENSGIIKTMLADSFAIQDIGSGISSITNSGIIIGKVALGGGDDDFDTSAGKVVGQINGEAGDDTLTGSIFADTMLGGADEDTLFGNIGNDTLTGGANADIFVFDTKPNRMKNSDVITDFGHVDDTIQLENAVFHGMNLGVLKAKFFHEGANAHDANDRIIYNEASGALYYDSDGTGKNVQVQFATIENHAAAGLARDDFALI